MKRSTSTATRKRGVPRTAVLGAILLSGYLGGATASHVRLEDGYFLLPVAFCVGLWVALYLRDPRLRDLVPLRRRRVGERRKPAERLGPAGGEAR